MVEPVGVMPATVLASWNTGDGRAEGRREVELRGGLLDRRDDRRPRMPGIDAPQAGSSVQQLAPSGVQ